MRLSLFLLLASPCLAGPVLTLQGTGPDSAISFQVNAPVPLDTVGLTTTFFFNFCNPPANETCDQSDWSAGGGTLRLGSFINGGGFDVRDWEFTSFINNGVYNTVNGSPDTGTVTVTGSTDAVPEQRFGLLTFASVLMLFAWRRTWTATPAAGLR
jgi:hypothetical protein